MKHPLTKLAEDFAKNVWIQGKLHKIHAIVGRLYHLLFNTTTSSLGNSRIIRLHMRKARSPRH